MHQQDPHRDCELHQTCAPLDRARLVVIAAHGRYGSAADILKIADQIDLPDIAWIAPEARGGSWWGESFLAPLISNEPGLTSALNRLSQVTASLMQQGIGPERIVLTGFSQGACLMLEYAARHPKPWRGVVAMSGGLLGTAEHDTPAREDLLGHVPKRFDYDADLSDLRIHIGCHAEDPVIPATRVRESADTLRDLGAEVTLDLAPGNMHGVLPGDLAALRGMLAP